MRRYTHLLQLLLFLCQYSCVLLQSSSEEQVLKLNGSVIATSSSIYKSNSGYLFHPNLAIKADSSSEGTNCFLSKKEESPWLTIELKSETTIFNIRLGVKDQSDGLLPSDYTLSGMTSLSVHVSNSTNNKTEIKTRCGDPWTYRMTKSIDLTCRGSLRGKFVHVTVPPSTTTYLAICSIVFNREEGALRLLNMSVKTVSLASSGSTRTESLALAIDGIISPSKCTSLSGESNAWLRVEIGSVRYIGMIRILFAEGNRVNTSVSVGRSLKSNGSVGNEKCGTVTNDSTAYGWKNITCSKSVFGQFIYIESSLRELQICEIQVFYGNIMDIYGTAYVSVSDQQEESGSIWKPIDGMTTPTITSSWISLKSGKPWWKVKFPQRSAISQVFIYMPKWSDLNVWNRNLWEMNGFTVHIEDSTAANGKANRMCGSPQKLITRTTAIRIICGETAIFGKYLLVAAADRLGAGIHLTEIVPHGCEEPNIELSRDTFNQRKELSCYVYLSTYSCPVTKTVLIGPDKQPINSAVERVKKSGHTIIKTVTVNSFNGLYACSVHYEYKGGSATKESTYTDLYSSPTLSSSTFNSMISSISTSPLALKPASTLTTKTPSPLTSESKSTLTLLNSTFTTSILPTPTLPKSSFSPVSAQPPTPTLALDVPAEGKGSGSVNVSAAVGSSLAAIIILLLLIILIRLRRRKRPVKKREQNASEMEMQTHGDTNLKDVLREPRTLSDFEKHVEEMHKDWSTHGFALEYSILEKEKRQDSLFEAKQKYNKRKNRYNNIVPYDHTRVILKEVPGVHGSDYINASYITAYDQSPGYIACQGPTTDTIEDFWRMIWQENVQTIVVVTKLRESGGKIKCSCYWPQVGKSTSYGDITVIFKEQLVLTDCTVRTFKLSHSKSDDTLPQTVTQFHFTSWPDHGVPTHPTSLLNFIKRVRNYQDRLKVPSPMVVHCSAGVGRTGTFIAIDYSFKRFKQENKIDIFNLVRKLRSQRPFMIQTVEQYVFCHDAVLEIMLCGDTSVEAPNMRTYIYMLKKVDPATENSGFEKQLKLLDKVSPSKDSFSYSGSQPNNETKNRYRTYVPPDERRVLLKGRQSQGSASAYICAMFVDGYRQKNSYIATQGPLKHTVEDFWQLIWENNIEFIVMMTRLEENGEEMSVQYWPFKGTETYGLVSATLKSEKMLQNYMIRKFRITNRLESETSKNVTQFHYLNWPVGQLPDTHSDLLHMINEIPKLQQQSENKTVVVVCNDGVHRCALFCAISIVLETLKTEQIVDIFQIVKALRLQNPDFVTSLMEYEFCYNITLVFLESFEEYANFKLL